MNVPVNLCVLVNVTLNVAAPAVVTVPDGLIAVAGEFELLYPEPVSTPAAETLKVKVP